MITISDKSQCCGCHACAQICPQQCISMITDEQGFLYPKADQTECTNCHLCEQSCPVINKSESCPPLGMYAAFHPEQSVRMTSSSGGLFSLLAEQIINQGGYVFGARFDKMWNVVHDYAHDIQGVAQFRGSKYVQSIIGKSFSQAKELLNEGHSVLFTGTPCQIAGLHHYLGKDFKQLLTIEVICHGVPSPSAWHCYIKDKNPAHVCFRDKVTGWKHYSITIGNTSREYDTDHYMSCFLADLTLRPSCFNCPAKSGSSQADIALGDLWGIEKIAPEQDDNMGTNSIITYTQRGEDAIKGLGVKLHEIDYQKALEHNPSIVMSAKRPDGYEEFWKDFTRNPQRAIGKWGKKVQLSHWTKFKRFIYRAVR